MVPQGATHEAIGLYYREIDGVWQYYSNKEGAWVDSTNAYEWHDKLLRALPRVHDTVQNPKHYQLLPGVGVYDIRQALAAKATTAGATLDQFSDYDRAVEYLLRMWEKNGVEDAQKAAWYLNKLVEKLNGSGS